MAKESLNALNSFLFEQLERLSNDDLTGEALAEEITRCGAIERIAKQVINNANVVLNAAKFHDSRMSEDTKLPTMLGDSNE